MKLSSQLNAGISSAMGSSSTSDRGRGGRGGRHSDTHHRGGPRGRGALFKTSGYSAGYEALMIRRGAPIVMDLTDPNHDASAVEPPSRFNYKGASPWASPPAAEADLPLGHPLQQLKQTLSFFMNPPRPMHHLLCSYMYV
jgi:hypothetical protein